MIAAYYNILSVLLTIQSLFSLTAPSTFSLMDSSLKKLSQALIDLSKKAEELDEVLTTLRTEINDMLWKIIDIKKNST